MISIEVQDQDIRRALADLAQAAAHPAPALKAIGENLAQSTKERFQTSTGPDGEQWAANSEATLDAYLRKFEGVFKQSGDLSKRGEKVASSKKPLIGETKSLSTGIYWDMVGESAVEVGSPQEYAAMQQFGGTHAEFPNLWGDIPARPFLGISTADKAMILDTLSDFLRQAFGP